MKKILLFKRNSRLCCILFLQLMFLPAFAFQQSNVITGTISDAIGTLPGVNITNQRTMITTQSDLNGAYEIEAQVGDALLFTFMGYKTQIVEVGEETRIDIQLEVDSTVIDEVVINAGYYTVKDRERTGSISRITAKDIEKQSVKNPLEALMGRMAGVDIVQTSGVPGSGFEVKIRGVNSIMAGNNPLYIIDGVPFDFNGMGSSRTSSSILPGSSINPLNAINPSIIESIEVLKDADATAIYGSRGANGVILITTKKGKDSTTRFSINSHTGIAQITRSRKLMNTEQYLEMRREAFENDGISVYPATAYDVNGTWSQERDTDWQKELLGGTAKNSTLQADVSGGNESSHYLVSGMYQNETTVFPGNFNYDRITINSSLNSTSKDKRFSIHFSSGYTLEKNLLPGADLSFFAIRLAPNAPELYDEDGNLNWENGTWSNPLALLEGKYTNTTKTLFANSILGYRLFKDFEIKVNSGYGLVRLNDNSISPHTMYNPAYGMNSSSSTISVNDGEKQNWIIEPQLSWNKQISNYRFSLLIGGAFQDQIFNRRTLMGIGFPSNNFIYNLSAAKTLIVTGEDSYQYKYLSYYGRLNVAYRDRLFLNFTGRRDGSSRFSKENQFGNFGAIGVGWIFSKDIGLSWLSFGKLRGSYGVTGNDQIGDYQYLQTFIISDGYYDNNIGLEPARLYNPNFKWEQNKKAEAAIDLGFAQNRINLSASYYNNRSTNQLINYNLPSTTGFTSIQSNLDAQIENSGWEFEFNSLVIDKADLSWNFSFHVSLPKNKLLKFPELESSSYYNQFEIGKSLSIVKLYHLEGVNPETGLYEVEDYNDDGIISADEDRKYIVDLAPKLFGGVSNNLRYKNWNLDLLFQFVKKDSYNHLRSIDSPGSMSNQPSELLDRWQNPADQALYQQFTSGANSQAYLTHSQFLQSNAVVSDGSFIRLKSASVSYDINLNKKSDMTCKLYIQAQNLLTFTRFRGGDPEQVNGYLPALKRISFGMQLKF